MQMYNPNAFFYPGQQQQAFMQQQYPPQVQAQLPEESTFETSNNSSSSLALDHEEIMHILAADDKDTKYQQSQTPAAAPSE